VDEMLGGTRITYLGHATFRVVTPGDEQIIIDPFLTDNPSTPEDMKEVDELDTILVTHGHFDHFADVIPLAQETGATVVSNFEIMSYLQGKGIENAQPIQKGGTAQIGGIRVTATNAFHSSSIQTEDGSLIYGGEPMSYVLEFESGFRLYHAGEEGFRGDKRRRSGRYGRADADRIPGLALRVVLAFYDARSSPGSMTCATAPGAMLERWFWNSSGVPVNIGMTSVL